MFGVKVEYSRKLLANHGPEIASQIGEMATALPAALSASIRARVQGRGDLAGQAFPGWASKPGNARPDELTFDASHKYPDKAQGVVKDAGAEWFDSAKAYHAENATRPGSYNVTGGMWSGLSVVVWSPTSASILFRGRSDGQDPRYVSGKKGKKSKPLKVLNGLKAATVLRSHGVNVLAISEQELAGILSGVQTSIAAGLHETMGVQFADRGLNGAVSVDAVFRQALGVL